MLAGLLLSMWRREVSPYTHHHIKQSRGWFCFFILVVFFCLFLLILWLIISPILWIFLFLITINLLSMLSIWWMCMYQAFHWEYIRKSEILNKFFAFFSWIWNWVLNLFDMNHYQIIDEDRYRRPEQFDRKVKNDTVQNTVSSEQSESVWLTAQTQLNWWDLWVLNSENSSNWWNSLDNNQQIVTNNQNIWIDLSGHEINNPENQLW